MVAVQIIKSREHIAQVLDGSADVIICEDSRNERGCTVICRPRLSSAIRPFLENRLGINTLEAFPATDPYARWLFQFDIAGKTPNEIRGLLIDTPVDEILGGYKYRVARIVGATLCSFGHHDKGTVPTAEHSGMRPGCRRYACKKLLHQSE